MAAATSSGVLPPTSSPSVVIPSATSASSTSSTEVATSTTSPTSITTSSSPTTSPTSVSSTPSSTEPSSTSTQVSETSPIPSTSSVGPTLTQAPTTQASAEPAPSPITSAVVTTNQSGVVVTQTILVTTSRASSSTRAVPSSTESSAPKSFSSNKGAVIGVSIVAALAGLGLIIGLATMFIRRRRAKRFDRDVDEAAREAAGAHVPEFDDEVYSGSGGAGGGYLTSAPTGYSDNSHGTYGQAPMDAVSGENYGMREMQNNGYNEYDNYSAAGVSRARSGSSHPESSMVSGPGMAGFGALGGSAAYSAYGATTSEHSSQPYPAFAHQYPVSYNNNNYPPAGSGDYAHTASPNNDYPANNSQDYDGYAAAAGIAPVAPAPSQSDHQTLNRQKSGARSLVDGYYSAGQPAADAAAPAESYASRYATRGGTVPPPMPLTSSNGATSTLGHSDNGARPLSSATYSDDPYGGYVAPAPKLSSHGHDNVSPTTGAHSPNRIESDDDDDEEDTGRRVLKVANN